MKKTILILIALIPLTLSACNTNNPAVDYLAENDITTEYFAGGDLWMFDSINQMNAQTTDVVRAVVSSSRTEPINTLLAIPCNDDDLERFYMIHTIHEIIVIEVFKGNSLVGDVLEIMQIGGLYNNRELVYPFQIAMNYEDEFIFFLQCFDEFGFGHLPMTIVGSYQGVFYSLPARVARTNEVFESIIEAYSKNLLLPNESLESVSSEVDLTLTIRDLVQIRYNSGLE